MQAGQAGLHDTILTAGWEGGGAALVFITGHPSYRNVQAKTKKAKMKAAASASSATDGEDMIPVISVVQCSEMGKG